MLTNPDYPINAPRVGDVVWIKYDPDAHTGGHYRTVSEIIGWTEEETPRLKFRAADPDGTLHLMAILLPAVPEPAVPGPRVHRAPTGRRLTGSEQRDVDNGSKCRAKGHDLTGLMPNGKPALYVAPNGAKLCQYCRAEGAAKRKELAGAGAK